MIKKLMFVACVLCLFTACKSGAAYSYSQNFVKQEGSLIPQMTKTEQDVARFVQEKDYASIAASGAAMEKTVDAKLQEITDAPAPDAKGGAEFKTACIKYFAFIKSIYTGYKNFGNATTEEERNAELMKVQEMTSKKMTVVADIQSAQKKFAADNGFKIQNK